MDKILMSIAGGGSIFAFVLGVIFFAIPVALLLIVVVSGTAATH